MTCNYLCPTAPPAIYREHHHQDLIPDKPQPEEEVWLVPVSALSYLAIFPQTVPPLAVLILATHSTH